MSEQNQGAAPQAESTVNPTEGSNQENLQETSGANEAMAEASEETNVSEGLDKEQPESSEEAIKQAEREMKRKFKLKVDGEEVEEEIDWSDEEGLKQKLQLAKVAQKRMQENALLKKDVESFVQSFQQDPVNAMKHLGVNFDDLAEQYVNSKLEELEKSPEELEREKQLKELEDLKKEREELQKAKENAEMERLREKHAMEIDNDIDSALSDNDFQLPKSPYVVKRVAETMMLAMQKGYNDVRAKDVLPIVQKQLHNDFQEMFGRMPEDVIEQVLGKGNLDRLRKKRIEKAKKARRAKTQTAKQVAKETGESSKNKEPKAKEKIPMKDFFNSLGKN